MNSSGRIPLLRAAAAALTGALCFGCATRPQYSDAGRGIADAAGFSEPVQFQTTAGPVDIEDHSGAVLTLERAVERTMRIDTQLQASLAQVRVALAEAKQARLLPNPILNVALRYPENGGSPTIEAGLTADLISLIQMPGRISAADHRLRAAAADAVTAALELLHDVQQRYATVAALDELMPVLEARRTSLDRLLDVAQSRLRNGEGTQLDVTMLQSQRVELDIEIIEKRIERREQRLALSRLIGNPSGSADWTLAPIAPVSPAGAERHWIETAMRHRPEIQQRKWELAALGADLSAAGFAALESAEAGVDAEREGDWAVGPAIAVPLPLLDWGQARRDRLDAQRIEAAHRLIHDRRRIIEEVRIAHGECVMLQQAFQQAHDQLMPLMQSRLEQAERQYLAGQTDVAALILAEQELQSARARRIELQRRAATAYFRLQQAAGGAVAAREVEQQHPHTLEP